MENPFVILCLHLNVENWHILWNRTDKKGVASSLQAAKLSWYLSIPLTATGLEDA